jgi:hypothetical protein
VAFEHPGPASGLPSENKYDIDIKLCFSHTLAFAIQNCTFYPKKWISQIWGTFEQLHHSILKNQLLLSKNDQLIIDHKPQKQASNLLQSRR